MIFGSPDRVFAGYVLDLDGTVYLGEELLPGAAAAVAGIRRAGSKVLFLTNNPLRTARGYARRLSRLGIPAAESEVITPLAVLIAYLSERHPGATVLTVAEPLVDATLRAAGFPVTTDPAAARVVVVSFDRRFDYAKLRLAFLAVRRHGAVIVATNPDPFCPSPDGGLPDCAAMLAAVEACSGGRAEAVLGKPGEHMAAEVRRRLGAAAADAVMAGDRLATDVAMSRQLGVTSVLVLSGATSAADLDGAVPRPRPDYVISGLGQLLPGAVTSQPDYGRPR